MNSLKPIVIPDGLKTEEGAGDVVMTSIFHDIAGTALSSLFQTMNELIMVLNTNEICVEIAPTRLPSSLPSPESLIGKSLREIYEPSEYQMMHQCLQQAKRSGSPVRFEQRLHIDGLMRWFGGAVTEIKGDGRFLWRGEDITNRKKMEEALLNSEQKYASLYENNHEAFLLIDPKSGRIVDANPMACTFYGYSREEIRFLTIYDINVSSPEHIQQLLQLTGNHNQNRFIFTHRLANGETRDVEVYAGPIQIKEKRLLLSNVHDISEMIQMNRRLHASETRLQGIMKGLNDLIVVMDSEGRCLDVAPTSLVLENRLQETLLGKTPHDLLCPTIAQDIMSRLELAFFEMDTVQFEYCFMRDDKRHWRWASITPLDTKTALYISRSITHLKAAECERKQSQYPYKQFPDMFPNPIFHIGSDGMATHFNRGWLDITGCSLEEEIGDGWMEHLHPDDRIEFTLHFTESVESHQSFQLTARMRTHADQYHSMVLMGAPFESATGILTGYIVNCFVLPK